MSFVNLAFLPQSHWAVDSGVGTTGGQWTNPRVSVPINNFRRSVYLHMGASPQASDWALEGVLFFLSNGQVRTQMQLQWGTNASLSPNASYFAFVNGTGSGVNSLNVILDVLTLTLFPHTFVTECDTVLFQHNNRDLTAGKPVWFLGVKSESLW
jgi:hypothetical protein